MSGIFDSIIDSIDGMDNWNWLGAAGAGLSSLNGKKEGSDAASLRAALNAGMMDLGGNNFQASRSKPAESADAESLEARWHQRLNKFANMQSSTSVKPR